MIVVLAIIVMALAILLAVNNFDVVTFSLWPFAVEWTLPFILWLYLAFVTGYLCCLLVRMLKPIFARSSTKSSQARSTPQGETRAASTPKAASTAEPKHQSSSSDAAPSPSLPPSAPSEP